MSEYEKLSGLERERLESECRETLYQVFLAAHNAAGWCGDVQEECWQAGLPIMREAMAKLLVKACS